MWGVRETIRTPTPTERPSPPVWVVTESETERTVQGQTRGRPSPRLKLERTLSTTVGPGPVAESPAPVPVSPDPSDRGNPSSFRRYSQSSNSVTSDPRDINPRHPRTPVNKPPSTPCHYNTRTVGCSLRGVHFSSVNLIFLASRHLADATGG